METTDSGSNIPLNIKSLIHCMNRKYMFLVDMFTSLGRRKWEWEENKEGGNLNEQFKINKAKTSWNYLVLCFFFLSMVFKFQWFRVPNVSIESLTTINVVDGKVQDKIPMKRVFNIEKNNIIKYPWFKLKIGIMTLLLKKRQTLKTH